MEYFLPGLFLAILGFVLLLNILTLPANWIMVILVVIWRFANPHPGAMDAFYFITLVGLALVGEVIEFLAQAWGTKRYGATNTGTIGGIIGAIAGAVVCAPFLLGVGALFGALIGAWCGCYVFELLRGRSAGEAWRSAKGAMIGRFFGICIKCGIGVAMLVLTYHAVWPGATPQLPAFQV
ncbi:MAG: DUF456 domain-containing protein [Desulfovibrio sp.]|jgi:uncharacterized protein YqgC (DUF456 family)|nr:DUF456 domain-containing protein [Desulfovibrio sp.]